MVAGQEKHGEHWLHVVMNYAVVREKHGHVIKANPSQAHTSENQLNTWSRNVRMSLSRVERNAAEERNGSRHVNGPSICPIPTQASSHPFPPQPIILQGRRCSPHTLHQVDAVEGHDEGRPPPHALHGRLQACKHNHGIRPHHVGSRGHEHQPWLSTRRWRYNTLAHTWESGSSRALFSQPRTCFCGPCAQ
jgi:hypothetical protein